MAIVLTFFALHWVTSVFFQSFFLHRYGAHRMFTMSKGWERFFYLGTYLAQGPSFLSPRGYAILHRMHHAFSDTEKDPHSPHFFSNPASMMWHTKRIYHDLAHRRVEPEPRFDGGVPEWRALDTLSQSWPARIAWGAAYTGVYVAFATAWWQFLLLPAHFVMGPIHGAIVNWCGHTMGYRNYALSDKSRNTLPFDFLTMGELFQNNHHKYGQRPSFATRWFEVDPTFGVMKVLAWLRIIQLGKGERVVDLPAGEASASV